MSSPRDAATGWSSRSKQHRSIETTPFRRHQATVPLQAIFAVLFMFSVAGPAFAQTTALAVDPPPTVIQVDVYSRPLTGDTFGPEERISVRLGFSEPVAVTGNPRLVLQVGDQTRGADLYAVSGNRQWVFFQHYVQASDHDDDGISIPANAVRLNRGSIRDSAGNDADLTHEAIRR